MKKLLILFMLVFSVFNTAFANGQEVVNSFKSFISPKISYVEQSYAQASPKVIYDKGSKYTKPYYYKQTSEFEYKLDVQVTDSLMSPYIGIVELKKSVKHYNGQKTEEKAKSEYNVHWVFIDRYRLVYNYDNGDWVFAKVTIYDDNMGGASSTYDMLGKDDESYYNMVRY